eukprot:TRINITY_DN10695_c0_g1_i1.p2 TRINITY_DN10695_c0_g1~~TRINITY_DN10695_c0_g1_i1.p2  ORF type:complete len:130 (-),score=29.13 TRINITY_DN10695_c0_g1_i1:4-393(-)
MTERTPEAAVDWGSLELCLVGKLQARVPGGPPHLCRTCHRPIAVYGRILPCLHVFCYSCAVVPGNACTICNTRVESVDRHDGSLEQLYVCMNEECAQAFPSEAELEQHTYVCHVLNASDKCSQRIQLDD